MKELKTSVMQTEAEMQAALKKKQEEEDFEDDPDCPPLEWSAPVVVQCVAVYCSLCSGLWCVEEGKRWRIQRGLRHSLV